MTKTGWTVLSIIVLVALLGGFAYAQMRAKAPVPAEVVDVSADTGSEAAAGDTVPVPAADDTHATVTVTYTDSGFSPKNITVNVGDTVRFMNSSTHGMWTASDAHPTHTEYDGTNTQEHCTAGASNNGAFDECSPANPGESFSFTFTKAGTFEYHNHVRASDTGIVVVK